MEDTILEWADTSVGTGDFGATAFLFRGKEFGHIHQNGDLDITFGAGITTELLKNNLVEKHLYVPKTNITYPLRNEEKLEFGISLLRMSYLSLVKNLNQSDADSQRLFEQELAKLPEHLSSIYLKQE